MTLFSGKINAFSFLLLFPALKISSDRIIPPHIASASVYIGKK